MKTLIFNNIKYILYIVFVLLILNLFTPFAYKHLPNDYVRTGLILENLNDPKNSPDIIVLGNSRGMSGVNARMLTDSTQYNVLNYCSPSQNLIESALYYDRLPSSVKYIIQCIDEKSFNDDALKLTEAALVAFGLNNYKVNSFERSILNNNDINALQANSIIKNLKARSAYKTGVSNLIVKLLDDDAPNENIKDLQYPYMYPSDSSKTFERDLIQLLKWIPNSNTRFSTSESIKHFFQLTYTHMKKKGVEIIYVLMPNCPLLNWSEQNNSNFREMVKDAIREKELIDCFTLMPSFGFYDPLHPNRTGAKIITQEIVNSLRSLNID